MKRGCRVATGLGVLLVLAGLACAANLQAERAKRTLYALSPGSIRARAFERMLEDSLSNVDAKAFGRPRDLSNALRRRKPQAVMALAPTLEANSLTPHLQGHLGETATEQYLVVSEGVPFTHAALANSTLGIVDVVGRQAMPSFVRRLLSLSEAPKLRQVTKNADLLPLLHFRRVDAVVISESAFVEMRSHSRLDFKVLKLTSARVRRMAVSLDQRAPDLETPFHSMPIAIMRRLQIDRFVRTGGHR